MNRGIVKRSLKLAVMLLAAVNVRAEFPMPETPFELRQALVLEADSALVIDGRGDDLDWQRTEWSPPFVDIRGYDFEPAPRHETRIKLLYDREYFYVLAWLEEPDLWATYDEHDMVIYHENDFEVFIDPDGDNHNYLELEINALGTTWDLLLTKPYRDQGMAVDAWEMTGLKSAVYLDGTLNDPSDTDEGWSVELAIPWELVWEVNGQKRHAKQAYPFSMQLNFSRVQWQLDVVDGDYVKRVDSSTGDPLPEDNWVWSPQGLIAMHYPERWGVAQMAQVVPSDFWRRAGDPLREMTMRCYYAQKRFYDEQDGVYANTLTRLDLPDESPYPEIEWPPELVWMRGGYQMTVYDSERREGMRVREDGYLERMPYHSTWNLEYMKGTRPRPDGNDNKRGD